MQPTGKHDRPLPGDTRARPDASGMLLRGGRVLTMDPALGDFDAADVLIADGVIRAVGPTLDAPAGAEIIDARQAIVRRSRRSSRRRCCTPSPGRSP